MLRRFLIILVCWPLLMPPGLCFCRMEAFTTRPVGRPAAAAGQDRGVTPKPKCRCCRQAEPAPSGGRVSCQADSSPVTPPQEGPHAPACPASPHWEAARVSLHAADGLDFADALFDAPVTPPGCTAQPSSAPAVAPPADHLAAPSLFSCNFRC